MALPDRRIDQYDESRRLRSLLQGKIQQHSVTAAAMPSSESVAFAYIPPPVKSRRVAPC